MIKKVQNVSYLRLLQESILLVGSEDTFKQEKLQKSAFIPIFTSVLSEMHIPY